jgi:hypothetical protein
VAYRAAVSKRRLYSVDATAPEDLSPEERRAQRRRERAKKKAGHGPETTSPWRKAAVISIPVIVIAVVALVLIISNLPTPCLQFTPIANSTPQAPNEPTFPASSGSDFSGTWCISTTPVYTTSFYLRIDINNASVALPSLIGERTNYSAGTCDLPLHTLIVPQIPGVVQIDSPWAYQYNLSMFFNVWSQTFSTVSVSNSNPNQPIVYQKTDILGYTANTTDTVTLFVDNQVSNAGPNLDVTTLDYGATTPSCLGKIYGTGHTILITYGSSKSLALRPLIETPSLRTGLADPTAILDLFYGPAPHFGLLAPLNNDLSKVQLHSLLWLVLRAGP